MLLLAFPQLFRRATAMVILVQAAWTMAAEGVRADDFAANQTQRRRQLWSLLGDLPRDHQLAAPRLRKKEHVEVKGGVGYTVEHLMLDLNGLEPVPAILLITVAKPQPSGTRHLLLRARFAQAL